MKEKKEMKNIIDTFTSGVSNNDELEKAFEIFSDPYHNLELRPILFSQWNKDELPNNQELPAKEYSAILDHIHHEINLNEKRWKSSRTKITASNIFKIAAILIIGILLSVVVTKFDSKTPQYFEAFAPEGSISQMILPDNSIIFLNSGSNIKYSIGNGKGPREVFLSGEAWFQVTKNNKKPFIVHTAFYDVNVLGTEFNVKTYPEDNTITTTLEKGSVRITTTDKFKIHSNQVLKPGEQLVYNKEENSIKLKTVDTKLFTSWKENKLIFINMSLKELIVLLERKYGVDIEVSDESILDFHYDGCLKNETIIEIMNIIKETLPIEYKIVGQKIEIIKKRRD